MSGYALGGRASVPNVVATDDVTAGDDLVVGDDGVVGDDLDVVGDLTAGTIASDAAVTAGTRLVATTGTTNPGSVIESGYVIAAQLTGNTNNWAPDLSKKVVYVDASGAVDLTGIAAQADGFMFELVIYGANTVTLKHGSASSSAPNRFNLAGAADLAIAGQFRRVTLRYGMSNTEWQVVSRNF